MGRVLHRDHRTGLTGQLLQLSSPMILANLAYALLGAADTFFLGRVSTVALGAVGLASLMFLTFSLLMRGTINGTTTFVSRMFGAGNHVQAGKYFQTFLFLSAIISPVILLLPALFRLYFGAIRPDPEVAQQALLYVSIRLWEIPFSLAVTACIGFFVGIGNSRTPMLLSWISVIVNVAANYVLIFGHLGFPAMGIAGAALGTVVAVGLQAVIALYLVFRRYGKGYELHRWELPSFAAFLATAKVGLPMGITEAMEVAAYTTFFALISRLGTSQLAASQIANQVASVAFMPGFALSAATGSLVSRFMGSRQLHLSRSVGYTGAALGASFMGFLGILFWIFSAQVGRVFSADPEVLAYTRVVLRMMAFYQAFDGFCIVFRGALNGAGDTRFTMAVTTIGSWAVFIPSVYGLAFGLNAGLVGAWLGAIVYIFSIGVVFGLRFWRGRWQSIRLQ